MIKTQLAASSVVGQVLAGNNLTEVLQTLWRSDLTLSRPERGAIQDLSYGVLRFYTQLESILALLLKKSLHDEQLRCLLLIGLYQLQYSKTQPHTVVNQAVSAVRTLKRGKVMQGLVNAILRNFIRQRDELLQKAIEKETAFFSHPQWWIDKLHRQYPLTYHHILEVSNKRPPMTLRVNRHKIAVEDYRTALEKNGIETEWLWGNALLLKQPQPVENLPGFMQGWVSVQDSGAQLAATLLQLQDGLRVLDACAAPGGKSTHILELADVSLTVLDQDAKRLAYVRENLDRLQFQVERLICGDAGNPDQWWDGHHYDRILADVPCSASGVVCRHPDIKWLRRESDLSKFSANQRSILDALWKILKKGGKLLYVTCSIFAEENTMQIDSFLSRHIDASCLPLDVASLSDGQLLPDIQHDGFFYALLQKN